MVHFPNSAFGWLALRRSQTGLRRVAQEAIASRHPDNSFSFGEWLNVDIDQTFPTRDAHASSVEANNRSPTL